MWRKLYKKVGKTFERDYKLLTKGKKVVHVGMKSYRRVEKLYFDETFYAKTKYLQVLLEDGQVFIW